jgi:hypothetical protein
MGLTVVRTISEIPGLSAGLPGPDELIEVGDACGANVFGIVHRVRERPLLLTRIARDVQIDHRLRRLQDLHALLTTRPVDGVHTFFWHGTVLDGTNGRLEHVLLETDLPRRAAALADVSISRLPVMTRLRLASSLVATVVDVVGRPATIGRLDASSVRLDLVAGRAIVTSLESGAFGPPHRQLVLDFGAPSGHLAPELYDGEGVHAEYAGARTDAWALAVTLHRLIFGCHPYAFVRDLRPDSVERELAANGWPGSATPAGFDAVYNALPAALLALFHRVFELGWADPGARPTAQQWSGVLEQCTRVPEFVALSVDRRVVGAGEPVTVTWTTRYANHVTTAAGLRLPPSGTMALVPTASGPIRLSASGLLGATSAATQVVLVLSRSVRPDLRPVGNPQSSPARPEPAIARPVPAVGRPDRAGMRLAGRPATARPAPVPRPSTVQRPPRAPQFPARPPWAG